MTDRIHLIAPGRINVTGDGGADAHGTEQAPQAPGSGVEPSGAGTRP
jgi:hypothetical protein